jgi:hypothetical protein
VKLKLPLTSNTFVATLAQLAKDEAALVEVST